MGIRYLRAICPKCGGKIHTQPKGLGHISLWANSWFLVQTGSECQHCGIALTGRVLANGKAQTAESKSQARPKPTTNGDVSRASGCVPADREGWWPDPTGRHELRYFDGTSWTWRVSDGERRSIDQAGAPNTAR